MSDHIEHNERGKVRGSRNEDGSDHLRLQGPNSLSVISLDLPRSGSFPLVALSDKKFLSNFLTKILINQPLLSEILFA